MILFSERTWEKEEQELIEFLKKHFKMIWLNQSLSIKGKLVFLSLLWNQNLYKNLVRIRGKREDSVVRKILNY